MFRYSYIIIPPLESLGFERRVRETLALLKECGYAGVEVNLTDSPALDLDRLEQWLDELDLVIPSFLTGEAYGQGLCLSSPDPSLRGKTVDRLVGFLEVARRFRSILVVGLLQGLLSDEPEVAAAQPRIREGLRQVASQAEAQGVEVVVEPVNHLQVGFNNSVAEVRRLVAEVGSPALKPMVDTIHMNVEERSLTEPILECGSSLRHVHLCESNGSLLGTGHLDFAAVLRALDRIGYEGFASVKVYRGASLEEAAHHSLRYLRRLHAGTPAPGGG